MMYHRYRLSLQSVSETTPRLYLLELSTSSTKLKSSVLTVVASELSPAEIHFVPEGLAVRTEADKGLFCAIEMFRWVRRNDKKSEAWIGMRDDDGTDQVDRT